MAASRWIKMLGVTTCLAIATGSPLDAQEATDGAPGGARHLGIDGWDLLVSGASRESGPTAVCSISTTSMAHPATGASGGRVTLSFEGMPGSFRLSSRITGGIDKGRPVEIWVDRHLIADQDVQSETIQFTEATGQSVMMLFKAGRLGAVKFHRSGEEHTVPISLTGFTRAIHTARQECQS